MRSSEDRQDQANIAVAEAFTAAARRQPAAVLRCARTALDHAGALGSARSGCGGRGRWPHAPRTIWQTPPPPQNCSPCRTATGPGSWPRCSAPNATWPVPASPPRTATREPASGLRQRSTPYHLAHGLLDHAEQLLRTGDDEAALAATGQPAGREHGELGRPGNREQQRRRP